MAEESFSTVFDSDPCELKVSRGMRVEAVGIPQEISQC